MATSEKFVKLRQTGDGRQQIVDETLGDMADQNAGAVVITGGTMAAVVTTEPVQAITAALAISLDVGHVDIVGPGSGTYAVTLAVPTRPGQILVLEMTATTSTNAVTLALTNVVGGSSGSSASFNAAGEILVLISASVKWVVLDELGVTLT